MKTLYHVTYNGEKHLMRADDRTAVRGQVLREIVFDARKATADDVAEILGAGGKIIEATNEPADTVADAS